MWMLRLEMLISWGKKWSTNHDLKPKINLIFRFLHLLQHLLLSFNLKNSNMREYNTILIGGISEIQLIHLRSTTNGLIVELLNLFFLFFIPFMHYLALYYELEVGKFCGHCCSKLCVDPSQAHDILICHQLKKISFATLWVIN